MLEAHGEAFEKIPSFIITQLQFLPYLGRERGWNGCYFSLSCYNFTLIIEMLFAAPVIFTVSCICIIPVLKTAIHKAWHKTGRGPSLQLKHVLAIFTYSIHLKISVLTEIKCNANNKRQNYYALFIIRYNFKMRPKKKNKKLWNYEPSVSLPVHQTYVWELNFFLSFYFTHHHKIKTFSLEILPLLLIYFINENENTCKEVALGVHAIQVPPLKPTRLWDLVSGNSS